MKCNCKITVLENLKCTQLKAFVVDNAQSKIRFDTTMMLLRGIFIQCVDYGEVDWIGGLE